MIIKTEDYKIENTDPNYSILAGCLRLPSPSAYNKPFKEIIERIKDNKEYTIDLSELQFLNSSGLTSLARIFLIAKENKTEVTLLINEDIPWQKKNLGSLCMLWDRLIIKVK